MKKITFIALITFIFSLLNYNSKAQNEVDSLKQLIVTAKQDTNKVKLLLDLGYQYQYTISDTALFYYHRALNISEEIKAEKFIAKCLRYIGIIQMQQGTYDKAISYFFKSLKIFEELEDKKGMSDSYIYIGIVHYFQGSYDKAISYYLKSLKIFEELGNKKGMSNCYGSIGNVHNSQGAYNKAISYYLKSLKIDEELDNKNGMSNSYNNIGLIHYSQGSYNKAINYYNKSLKIAEELGNKEIMSACYNGIGLVHWNQGSYNKAISYYLKSLKIAEELGNKNGMSNSYNNIGIIHKEQGSYSKAISYYLKSLKIREELGDKNGLATSYVNIASLNIMLADSTILNESQRINYLNKAIQYGNKSYNLAKKIGAMLTEKNAANYLMDAYTKLGKYKEAIKFAQIFIVTKDSLFNEEKTKELANLEAKYEYEKQKVIDDAESEKLIAIEQEEKEKQKVISFAIAGGLVLVVIFLIFVFNRLRVTRKQKRVIEEQKTVVEIAHHELEEKNQEILDSINYAKRIQSAILPPLRIVKEYLKESFILYKPKDVVAGDFYWLEHKDGKVLFAAADCTGHGVPGAMVSVVCNNALNRSVREYGLTEPGQILDKAREIVIQEFEKSDEEVKDGMDIALCSLDGNKLQYAGANNPLWIIRKGEILETKANKQPIGKFDNPLPYTTHSFELQKGDTLYIFSDGYVDQFGGEKGKKFKPKALRELLLSIQDKQIDKQKLLINETFENWRGSLEQIDDVCVIGVKI